MASISGSGIGFAARTAALARSSCARLPVIAAACALVVLLPGAMPLGDLHIDIAKLRSSKGMVRICLTADPKNFPACVNDARALTRSVPASDTAITFGALPQGDYALAVIHDENSNNKLDTIAGIPREGFGFSRNPAILFGAPRFSAARFTMTGDAEKQQIRMKYMF